MLPGSIGAIQTAGGASLDTATRLGLIASLSGGGSLPADIRAGLPPIPLVSPGSSLPLSPGQAAAGQPIAFSAAGALGPLRAAVGANVFASGGSAAPHLGTGLANTAPVAIAAAAGLPVLGFIQSAGLASGTGLPVSLAGGAGVLNPAGWLAASFLLGYGIGKLGLWAWESLNKITASQFQIPGDAAVASGTWDPAGPNLWTVTISGSYYSGAGLGSSSCTILPFAETQTFATGAGGRIWVKLPAQTSYYTCFNFGPNGVAGYGGAIVMSGGLVGAVGATVMANRMNQSVGAAITVRPNSSSAGVPFGPADMGITAVPKPRTLPAVLPVTMPGPDQKPKPVPPLIQPIPAGDPLIQPAPSVAPLPLPAQVPIPASPGAPAVPTTTTRTTTSGLVAAQPKPQVPVTPPDWHFVNGQPIPDGGVRPDLASIAKEVGRIEQKAALVMAPDNMPDGAFLRGLADLVRALLASTDRGSYTLRGVCETDANGTPVDNARTVNWGGSLFALDNVSSRIDALASLLQHHKDLKQPTCPPERIKLQGDWVTLHFISDEPSPMGDKPLRKRFRYRDQTSTGHEAHIAHWLGFSWQAGPIQVKHDGHVWGTPQVWASTADEGKRVIRHAGLIAGVDPDSVGRWEVAGSRSARIGQTGIMRVQHRAGVTRISMRDGSDGPPLVPIQEVDPGVAP